MKRLENHQLSLFLKNLLYLVTVPASVAVYVPLYLVYDRKVAAPEFFFIAVLFLAIGGVFVIRGIWDFANFGVGTPLPIDPPQKLVASGIYRYTRNPIYIGIIAVILGWAVIFQSRLLLIYAFWACLFLQGFVMFYEEPHLRKVFGIDYENYCSQVARWLPSLFRR